jgi:hypothetical protein
LDALERGRRMGCDGRDARCDGRGGLGALVARPC